MPRVGRVSVALLSWNGLEHLRTCLPALEEQLDPGVPWEILLLDNGSRDGTSAWVRERFPAVRILESPTNLGFCAGYNRLVEAARGDAVALLNNDTRPRADWLRALVGAFAAAPDDVAAVAGQIVDWEGERLDFGRGLLTFDGHAFQLDYRRPLPSARLPCAGEEVLFGCGGNLLVRRESFRAAGGFDERFFAYLEDVDLGWRLWAGGERVLAAPAAIVHHRSAATSDLLGLYNRGFLFERNAYLTAYRNYEAGLWQQVMPALLLTLVSRTQALLVENNPGGEALAIDPYAGHIADTAAPASVGAHEGLLTGLARRYREYGLPNLVGRALAKARREWGAARQGPSAAPATVLSDPRTVAQLRAISWVLAHLDAAAEERARCQARRRRSDCEIFERFPLYLVPTYPGDVRLFASPGFRRWLPAELPLIEATLAEIMQLAP